MGPWLPLTLFALFIGGLMILLTRYQARKYQDYLARQTDTAKEMVAEQRRTQEAVARQTAALERIAVALERERA
ncbi:MAG: hypothetical protein IH625_05160 [Rhodobacteraceae bacterium]|nr:hypothetical protein [Paracoccaceae bacterium]